MIKIQTAKLIEYNANDRGKYAPDCVKRAISMAFSKQYSQVAKDLRAAEKEYYQQTGRKLSWKTTPVYSEVIKQYGGSDRIFVSGPKMTVAEFADTHQGTYVVESGRTSSGGDHLVCVIDGEVFDSWDSLDQIVISYHKVEGTHKPKSNIKDKFSELIDYASNAIDSAVSFRLKKFGLLDAFTHEETTYTIRGFAFQIYYYLQSEEFDYYLADIAIVYALSPTTTFEEAIEYIDKITSQRVYDRVYVIREKLKDLQEAAAYEAESPVPEHAGHIYVSNRQEERFYRSLPTWLKRRLTYLNVYAPGEYSNSYSIEFVPLPGDPDDSDVEFEGYTADEVRHRVDRYKNHDYDREWYEY